MYMCPEYFGIRKKGQCYIPVRRHIEKIAVLRHNMAAVQQFQGQSVLIHRRREFQEDVPAAFSIQHINSRTALLPEQPVQGCEILLYTPEDNLCTGWDLV